MNQLPQAKLFIEGRYRKLCRDLPQTVFFCPECKGHPRRRKGCERCEGFGKLTRDSVQELIAWVAGSVFKTRKNKFHGAGREDVNVRMLGAGRPFVLEMINPKVADVNLAELEAEINRRNEDRMEVVGLHWSEKARVRIVKEEKRAKRYRALVSMDPVLGIDKVRELIGKRMDITQKTPDRVAHRRAILDRQRWIVIDSVEPAPDGQENMIDIQMRTQHGTYVKEVISGEGEKTNPSLAGLLGVACECVELDVLDILAEDGEVENKNPEVRIGS